MSVIMEIESDFDAATVQEIRPRIEELAHADDDVTIDMKNVEFLDSSGVGAIIFLMKRLRAAKRDVRLTNVSGQPLELITYLRMTELLEG